MMAASDPGTAPELRAADVQIQTSAILLRRRQLLVLIVIVLAGFGGFAYLRLGRIDPRLFGRWVNSDPNVLPAECTFTSDGRSSWIVAYISVPLTTGYGWSVRGNELVLANHQPFRLRMSLTSVRVNLGILIDRLKDEGVVERLQILEVTEGMLKLKREHPWGSSRNGVETYLRQNDKSVGSF